MVSNGAFQEDSRAFKCVSGEFQKNYGKFSEVIAEFWGVLGIFISRVYGGFQKCSTIFQVQPWSSLSP